MLAHVSCEFRVARARCDHCCGLNIIALTNVMFVLFSWPVWIRHLRISFRHLLLIVPLDDSRHLREVRQVRTIGPRAQGGSRQLHLGRLGHHRVAAHCVRLDVFISLTARG